MDDCRISKTFAKFVDDIENYIGAELYRDVKHDIDGLYTIHEEAINRGSELPPVSTMLYKWNAFGPHTPSHISRICCVSAVIYLITAIVSLKCRMLRHKGLGVFSLILFISSIMHWNETQFTGWIRSFDITMAFSTIIYATVISLTLPHWYGLPWMIGFGVSIIFWRLNEVQILDLICCSTDCIMMVVN